MSFGFSIGDFIAIGKLVKDISSSLQDVGGAKSEYQELLRELECLKQALQHLNKLHNAGPSSPNLDSIKYAALSCRRPLEQFLEKIRKYDKSLCVSGTGGLFKGAVDKVRWGLGQKEEVRKLQSYLNVHVGTINILLAEFGLEKMDIALNQADKQHSQVKETLNSTRSMIGTISSRLVAQKAVLQSTKTMLARLCDFINGDFGTSWKSLEQMVAKICVSTQQSYTLLLEIRCSLVRPDTRWMYFQAPLVVEDAFGCKFPVPSEYDFNLLDTIVRKKFDTGPGSLDVLAGNYEYFKTKNSADVLSKTSRLLPGTAITMAVIIVGPTLTDETCPMPKCRSNQTSACSGGGRTCCQCHVWFSPTKKRRRTLEDDALPDSSIHDILTEARPIENVEPPRKRHKAALEKEAGNTYKNVRLSNAFYSQSESSLTVFAYGHHKPCHRNNNSAHVSSAPYKIPRPHTLHGHATSAAFSQGNGFPPATPESTYNEIEVDTRDPTSSASSILYDGERLLDHSFERRKREIRLAEIQAQMALGRERDERTAFRPQLQETPQSYWSPRRDQRPPVANKDPGVRGSFSWDLGSPINLQDPWPKHYDSDDALQRSPSLVAVKPRATPSPSPLPSLSSRRRKKPNRRRPRLSQGDIVLIRVMDPNQPNIARQVSERELNPDSGSEADDEEIEDLPQTRESHLQEPPTVQPGFYGLANNRSVLSGHNVPRQDTSPPPPHPGYQSPFGHYARERTAIRPLQANPYAQELMLQATTRP